jgi:hypothetical protein
MLWRLQKPRLLAVIGSGSQLACAACAQAAVFRDGFGGMSEDAAKQTESGKPLQENDATLNINGVRSTNDGL